MANFTKYSQLAILYISLSLYGVVISQSTLEYNIFEEEQLPMDIADLLLDSGLRDRYTPDIVAILTLEISEHPRNHHRFFSVTTSGTLTVSSRLDRDEICPNQQTCVINLDIKVNPTEYFAIIKVDLTVSDKNDNIPSFGIEDTFVISFAEGSLPDVPHGLPLATDPDSPSYDIGSYQLSGQGSDFSLETFNGNDGTIEPLLRIHTNLDREAIPQYTFILLAIDKGSPRRTGSVTIILQVTDVNDQYPVFDSTLYEKTIDEDMAPGTFVLAVRATDEDEEENAQVQYAFAPQVEQSARDVFDINQVTGDITVIGILDYETQQDYSLTIVGRDMGQSPLSSQTRVLIRLEDVNDNPPIIELNSAANGNRVNVQENSDLETFVAYIRVTDPDSGENGQFGCELDSADFVLTKLHQNDFTLKTDTVLDRENVAEYFVNVVCRDNGQSVKTSSLIIEVTVTDDNDNPPQFEQNLYTENILESNEVGQTLMTVKATDLDIGDNGAITYSLSTSSFYHTNSFRIDPVIGDITVTGPIDHEEAAEIDLIVTATDHGTPSLSSNTTVRITVIDTDDEPPRFVLPDHSSDGFSFAIYEHESSNSFVDQVVAIDRDSPQYNTMAYAIRSQNTEPEAAALEELPFRIDSVTGDLYSTMELDREDKSTYTFIVIATGNPPNNWQSEETVTVHVADKNDHAPRFMFPNIVNNTAYLSSSVKQGVIVTDIRALDEDESDNALLRYSMTYDARDVMFTIDEMSGRITAARDFNTKQEVVVLTVSVRDSGRTPLEDTAYLNVVFSPKSSSSSGNDFNEALVIAIAVVAAVVVTILVLAIVCLLRRHNRAKQNSDYLKNCNEIMNANNVIHDQPDSGPPPSNAVVMHKNNLGNNSLDSSFQSSVIDKNSLQNPGQDNRGMVYDSDRGSFVVQPWKQAPSNLNINAQLQAGREKAIPEEEDSDSACSLEGSNSDSGRGSNDDCSMSRHNPPIPQRHPVAGQRNSGDWMPTRHLPPGVHSPSQSRSQGPRNIRQLYPDNKQYYDERVYRNGANRSHDRLHDLLPPAYPQNPRSLHVVDRTHVPSPSPSLQYQPGHDQTVQNIHRQQSLNLPDVPPRKSVHYCSQV